MSILFNKERVYTDGVTPTYPLFLGESMSLNDGVDTQYPELERLMLTQRSQFWVETSIDLTNDQKQWSSLDKNTQDIAVFNLAWQSQADTFAGRAPIQTLMTFVTNPELEQLINVWQYFEQIHTRSYQHIIRSIFPDPERIRNAVANLEPAMRRMDVLVDEFDALHRLSGEYILAAYMHIDANGEPLPLPPEGRFRIQQQIVRAMAALYALESIQFFGSFACTFKLADNKIMVGTADILKLIAKDESLHTHFTVAILKILGNDPEWAGIVNELMEEEFERILYNVVDSEKEWADFLFSEGRQIVGLNAELMKDYIDYLATGAFKAVGLEYDSPMTKHPIPYVEKYLNPEMMQVAPQERNVTNYAQGGVAGDVVVVDVDLDFL